MSVEQLIFVVAVAYASLTVGILIKFKNNGLSGASLWLAPFAPLIVFIGPILVVSLVDTKKFKEKFGNKPRKSRAVIAWKTFVITVLIFPLLVGAIAQIIKNISTSTKRREAAAEAIPTYVRELYHQMAF